MIARTFNPVSRRPVGAPPFPQWRAPNPQPQIPAYPVYSNCIGNPATVIATGPYSANPNALRNPWPGAEYSGYQANIASPMLGGMPGVEYSGYQRNAYIAYGAGVGRQGFAARPNPCGFPMPNPCGPVMPNPCDCEGPQPNPCGPKVPQYGPDRAPRLNPCGCTPGQGCCVDGQDCGCGPQSNPCGCTPGQGCCVDGQNCECPNGPVSNPCGCMPGQGCCVDGQNCECPNGPVSNPGVQLSCQQGYELGCVSWGGPNQECRCKKCGGVPYTCNYLQPVVTQIPFQRMGQLAASKQPYGQMVFPNPCGPQTNPCVQGSPCCPGAEVLDNPRRTTAVGVGPGGASGFAATSQALLVQAPPFPSNYVAAEAGMVVNVYALYLNYQSRTILQTPTYVGSLAFNQLYGPTLIAAGIAGGKIPAAHQAAGGWSAGWQPWVAAWHRMVGLAQKYASGLKAQGWSGG